MEPESPSCARSRSIAPAIAAAAVALSCACGHKVVKKPLANLQTTAVAALEPNIRNGPFSTAPELKTVYFDFDRHQIKKEVREILKKNADALKRNPEWEVLVEGHCDQRGSVEYNLALGQKRAKEVRDYYLLLGVAGNRVATLSFGMEKPVCGESEESCWSRNRRAMTKIKTSTAAMRSNPPSGG